MSAQYLVRPNPTARRRARPPLHSMRVQAGPSILLGLLENVGVALLAMRGISCDLRHPTDMPMGLFWGAIALTWICVALLIAVGLYFRLRSAEPEGAGPALAVGIGLMVAPVAMPLMWCVMYLFFMPIGWLAGAAGIGIVIGYVRIVKALVPPQRG